MIWVVTCVLWCWAMNDNIAQQIVNELRNINTHLRQIEVYLAQLAGR